MDTRSSPPRSSRWGRSLATFADLREGEGKAVFGASLTLGGIVAAHTASEAARDAIFLTALPPHHLAFVYIALAFLAGLVGYFEQGVARLLGRTNALILTLMLSAMGTTLFYVADKGEVLSFVLYLWTGLIGTLLTLQYWLFVAGRFTAAQGRRLFGMLAAGGVLGAVVGGGISALFTRWFEVDALLAVAATFHLSTALLVTTAPEASEGLRSTATEPLMGSLKKVLSQRYTRGVTLLSVLATATVLCTDYLFKSLAAERVAPDDLANFFSTYYASMNGLALIVQLFIVMRVLQRAGTIFALTLLPVALLAASAFPLVLGGVFAGAMLARGADGALRHSLHRVSTELLFLPLSPSDRATTKSLIDTFVARGMQGVTALGLLVLAGFNQDRPEVLFPVIFTGATLWLIVALSLRGPYLDQFRASIGLREGSADMTLGQMSLDGVEVVVESLSSTDEDRVLGAIRIFEEAGRTGLIPALLLYHPSDRVIHRALEVIPNKSRQDWPELARRLLDHRSEDVRFLALTKLAQFHHLNDPDPAAFDSPRLKAAAAFFRADKLDQPLDDPIIQAIVDPSSGSESRLALLSTIASHGSMRWADTLLCCAEAGGSEVDQLLPRAMSRVRDPRFLPMLIDRLAFREARSEVRRALADMGTEAFEALKLALTSSDTPSEVRLHVPRAISRFNDKQAADFLLYALSIDLPGAVRFKALRGLGRLVEDKKLRIGSNRVLPLVLQNAHESLKNVLYRDALQRDIQLSPQGRAAGILLTDLLDAKHLQSLERVTRLLQLLHPRENLRRVYLALREGGEKGRTAAGELLEGLTLGYGEDLRQIIRELSDPRPTIDRTRHILELLGIEELNAADVLRDILVENDPALAAIAVDFIDKRKITTLAAEARRVEENNPWLDAPFPRETVA